jgi:hypothetical protein
LLRGGYIAECHVPDNKIMELRELVRQNGNHAQEQHRGTNEVVFAGHNTATGKPYKFSPFGGPTSTPLNPSEIIFVLEYDITTNASWINTRVSKISLHQYFSLKFSCYHYIIIPI